MQNNQNQPIWNPSTVASLSLILTPAFGSLMQAINWKSLGQPERASASKAWFYTSLFVLAAVAAAVCIDAKGGGDTDGGRGLANIGGLVYFFIWYALSGRKQISYVKNTLGKTYAMRSLFKPVLAALGAAILYAVAVFGLLVATQGASDAADKPGGQSSLSGSLSSVAALFGSAPNLDCASKDVKQIITDNLAETFIETSIPDLVWALERKRITLRVEMITETGRSKTSPFVNCKGNLVVVFPEEDLNKAKKMLGDGGLAGIYAEAIRRTGPVFNEAIVYRVSIPADKEERKNGPLVETRFVNPQRASDTIAVYGAAYGTLADAAPDVSASGKNTVKWDKEFRDVVMQECGKQPNAALCKCKIEQFAQVLKQEDFQRISFLVHMKSLDADKYRNFIALSDSLDQQCPLRQGITSVLAPSQD